MQNPATEKAAISRYYDSLSDEEMKEQELWGWFSELELQESESDKEKAPESRGLNSVDC